MNEPSDGIAGSDRESTRTPAPDRRPPTLSTVRTVLTNYTWLALGELIAKLFALWATLHLARVFGPERYGDLAFATAVVSYFALVAGRGTDPYGTSEVARAPHWLERSFGGFLSLRLVTTAVAGALLLSLAHVFAVSTFMRTLISLYGLTLVTGAISLDWLFKGLEDMRSSAVAQILTQAAFAAGVLWFVTDSGDVLQVPAILLAGQLLGTGYLVARLAGSDRRYTLTPQPAAWRRMLAEAVTVGLSSALGVVLYNFDMVMLGILRDAGELGQYYAAYGLMTPLGTFVTLYYASLFPSIARVQRSPSLLDRVSDLPVRFALLVTVPLAAGGTMLAEPIMALLFGDAYLGGSEAFGVLIWVVPITAIRSIYRLTLLACGMYRPFLWINVLAVAVNVTLNFWAIPRYGLLGAAVTTVASEAVMFPLAYIVVKRRVQTLVVSRHLWRPLLACGPMLAVLALTAGAHVVTRVLIGAVTFALTAWVIRAFTVADLRAILAAPPRDGRR